MPDIDEVEQALLRGKKEKHLNIPWWNIVRKAEYHWMKNDFFSLNVQNSNIWAFEESRKEYSPIIISLVVTLFFSTFPLFPILYLIIKSNSFDERLLIFSLGITLIVIEFIVCYLLWHNFFYLLFSSLSHKTVVFNWQRKEIILEYQPWLTKDLRVEIPFSKLKISIKKEFASDQTPLYFICCKDELTNFQIFRSSDRKVVEQSYNKLYSLLQR